MLPSQPNFTRKATACLHSFIPFCADSIAVGMVICMNKYLINILEQIKSGNFDDSTFAPDKSRWTPVKLWYHKYSEMESISDDKLLDLLYFFYFHEDLDFYEYAHFSEVVQYIHEEYGVRQDDILEMLTEFRKIIYGRQ